MSIEDAVAEMEALEPLSEWTRRNDESYNLSGMGMFIGTHPYVIVLATIRRDGHIELELKPLAGKGIIE